jgi:REP element-mobilizing transposase RayT
MPPSLRLEFPGAYYHVMARGIRRETIFHDDDDRRIFLATLSEACAMTGWRVHAWVLMGNHYHLFIETPEPNLVAGMSWLQNTVTRRHNVRHGAWDRLFGDRYMAVLVDGADSYHGRGTGSNGAEDFFVKICTLTPFSGVNSGDTSGRFWYHFHPKDLEPLKKSKPLILQAFVE